MTETVEEAVVSKRARVVEEVVVQKEVDRTHGDGPRDRAAHRGGRPTGAGDSDGDQARDDPPRFRDLRPHLPGALHHGLCHQWCGVCGV